MTPVTVHCNKKAQISLTSRFLCDKMHPLLSYHIGSTHCPDDVLLILLRDEGVPSSIHLPKPFKPVVDFSHSGGLIYPGNSFLTNSSHICIFLTLFLLAIDRSCQWWRPSSPSLRCPRLFRNYRRATPGGKRWSGLPRRTTGGRAKRRLSLSEDSSRRRNTSDSRVCGVGVYRWPSRPELFCMPRIFLFSLEDFTRCCRHVTAY